MTTSVTRIPDGVAATTTSVGAAPSAIDSGDRERFELGGHTAPAPPKWKMFVASSAAIYILQLVLNHAINPLRLPVPLRIALIAVAVTALMTWLVVPRLARLLQAWLDAPNR
jgi:uncharacterized protein